MLLCFDANLLLCSKVRRGRRRRQLLSPCLTKAFDAPSTELIRVQLPCCCFPSSTRFARATFPFTQLLLAAPVCASPYFTPFIPPKFQCNSNGFSCRCFPYRDYIERQGEVRSLKSILNKLQFRRLMTKIFKGFKGWGQYGHIGIAKNSAFSRSYDNETIPILLHPMNYRLSKESLLN